MTQYGFFVDLSRCIGCNSCTVSCKQWHDMSPGPDKPMRVYQWETGTFPNVNLRMLPIMCYHCETPLCLEACPNHAIYKEDKYGAVLVDPAKCSGERKCWQGCPYGTPQFENDEPGTKMVKCDMCIDRLEEGLKPICVLSCSMRALEFGPLDELIKKYGNLKRLGAEPGHAPCRLACPAAVDAEGYINLIAQGKFGEALQLFRESAPFAGVLGRVCTHPCEADCQRGKIDESVAICALKRFMADAELEAGRVKAMPVQKTREERVAVIGSGPAGLACTYDLVRKGYPVAVFEAAPGIGGLMRYGIPEYRLPKAILDNEVSLVAELGVEIKANAPVKSLDDVFNQGYKAIFLATGAGASQKLNIAGEDAAGVVYALDFLKKVNSGEKVGPGRRVVVIGGGSVAIDAARTSLRLGAEEVHMVCLESRDLACRDRMLAQTLEIEEAEEEGVIIHPCLGVDKILARDGRLAGVETITCASVWDEAGSFAPRFVQVPGPAIAADTMIVAIGQRVEKGSFADVARTKSGTIKVDDTTLETNVRGVFAGGEVASGPADVISAVAAGKQAAVSIERYLNGEDLRQGRRPLAGTEGAMAGARSARLSVLSAEKRKGFVEVRQGLDKNTAIKQAERCLHCGSTMPAIIFRPMEPHRTVIPWDPIKALELWRERQPYEGEPLPDIFAEISDITEAPQDIVGRNRLVLKTRNSEELLYYTTDNE